MNIQEMNCKTNEIIVREMTDSELSDFEQRKQDAEIRQAEYAEQITKKAAAEAKLAALGLTTDDLKALGLN